MMGEQCDWIYVPFDELLLKLSNGLTATQYKAPPGVPVSRIETISHANVNFDKVRYVRDLDNERHHRFLLRKGDILFSHINSDSHLGKCALYRSDRPLLHGMNLLLIRSVESYNSQLLEFYLQFLRISGYFIGIAQHAVNQSSLNQKKIKDIQIPLLPLNEQRRIVAKIEELFSEVDAGVASLKTARAQLGVYRQSQLKQAFEGKLTEQWRLSARKRAQAGLSPVRARQAGAVLEDVIPESISKWFTYIIECEGESYYVGSTGNLRKRWLQHCEGEGADWTKANAPRYLVHFEIFDTQEEAIKREQDLKTGFGRTWRKREIKAGRIKPLIHNSNNQSAQPVRGEALQTGEQLLARIRSEREARYQQQLADWQTAVEEWEAKGKEGKKPSKPRPPKDLQPLDSELLSELSRLPNSWGWDKLGWMTCGSEYGSSAKSEKTGDCPVIRMGNIQRGELDWDDLVYSNNQEEIDQYLLSAGDVLFNRTNSPQWVGKTAIYRGTRPAIFAGYLIRVNQINSIVESSYLNYYLNSHTARQYGNTVKTDGVNQSNINGDKLVNYPFPFCSIPEQKEIVRILEAQFTAIEQNEAEIDAALQRAEALRQSILKKAFAGKLVPQDPNDEPASVLLERIRAERAASEAELKGHKKAVKKRARKKTAISAKTTSS